MPRFDLSTYVDVQTRITQFWADHPDGRIITSLQSDPNDREHAIFRADVYVRSGDDYYYATATGWAQEIKGPQGANQTSHLENAETSAIGRALANLGYATSLKDRPSREEMGKVVRHGEATTGRTLTPKQPTGDPMAILSQARFNKTPDSLNNSEKRTIDNWITVLQPDQMTELIPLLDRLTKATSNDELNTIAETLARSSNQWLNDKNVVEAGKLHRKRVSE